MYDSRTSVETVDETTAGKWRKATPTMDAKCGVDDVLVNVKVDDREEIHVDVECDDPEGLKVEIQVGNEQPKWFVFAGDCRQR